MSVRRRAVRFSFSVAISMMLSGLAIAPGRARAAEAGGSIRGWAWETGNTPVPHARLQARSLASGDVEATTTANEAGEFTFEELPAGDYVIEVVDESGKLVAIGRPLSLVPEQTAQAFVWLPAPLVQETAALATTFASTAASSVVSAAASLGVSGIAPTGRPASRER